MSLSLNMNTRKSFDVRSRYLYMYVYYYEKILVDFHTCLVRPWSRLPNELILFFHYPQTKQFVSLLRFNLFNTGPRQRTHAWRGSLCNECCFYGIRSLLRRHCITRCCERFTTLHASYSFFIIEYR